MIYGSHRTKGAPALGALPGHDGPFGSWPEPPETDDIDSDAAMGEAVNAAMVPSPGSGNGW